MTAEAAVLNCSICGEPSTEICVYCTKDTCANHRCDRCKRCSDCCECEVPRSAGEDREVHEPAQPVVEAVEAARRLEVEAISLDGAGMDAPERPESGQSQGEDPEEPTSGEGMIP